jgi:integrase
MVSRAITQQSTAAETTKTTAGRREVKLLAGALEALQAQKAHTWLAGEEVFQNPNTSDRWAGDLPIRKTLWTHVLSVPVYGTAIPTRPVIPTPA